MLEFTGKHIYYMLQRAALNITWPEQEKSHAYQPILKYPHLEFNAFMIEK